MIVTLERHVVVKKITKGKYVAEATSVDPMKIEFSIGGDTEQDAIDKWNKMFEGCEFKYLNQ